MPLLDHFREPLWPTRQWHSFHNAWATFIASDLNKKLPEGYFAEGNVQFNIEIDVASLQRPGFETGLAEQSWQPPAPTLTLPFTSTTDIVEIQINETSGGTTLVGAIELVSPANKDRESSRDAFVNKCANYLQQGIGLVIIDVVTARKSNLHNELMKRLTPEPPTSSGELYAISYHPVQEKTQLPSGPRNGEMKKSLDIWAHDLKFGAPLPTLPFFLKGGLCLRLDLETSYVRTCQEYRLPLNGQ